jgi:hypothetical protein
MCPSCILPHTLVTSLRTPYVTPHLVHILSMTFHVSFRLKLSYIYYHYHSVRSIIAGKFDKCLHFLSIFIPRKLTIGLIIRYV